jgi:hypothetical protein
MSIVDGRYPYVLAFEPTFVEIRRVETGLISQVILVPRRGHRQQTHTTCAHRQENSFNNVGQLHVNSRVKSPLLVKTPDRQQTVFIH